VAPETLLMDCLRGSMQASSTPMPTVSAQSRILHSVPVLWPGRPQLDGHLVRLGFSFRLVFLHHQRPVAQPNGDVSEKPGLSEPAACTLARPIRMGRGKSSSTRRPRGRLLRLNLCPMST
jgi:hypothetical protein